MFLNCWIHHININKHYMQCKNVHDHHWFITRNTNHAYTTKISMYHLWTKELPSFLSISFLIITSAKPLTAMANKDELIHKPSKPTANERPNPINPMIFPTPAHHCRPKWCSRVHGCPIKRPTHQNIRSNDETNHNWRHHSQTTPPAPRVNGGRVHRVHQPECHHHLQHHRVPHSHATRKFENRYILNNRRSLLLRTWESKYKCVWTSIDTLMQHINIFLYLLCNFSNGSLITCCSF